MKWRHFNFKMSPMIRCKRFERNMKVNDPSGDGFVTGPEIYLDFRTNYDLDLNGQTFFF